VISLATTSCTNKKPTLKSVTPQPTARSGKIPDNNYTELDAGNSPLSPLSADFNNDGYNDIAVISHGDSQLKIFWGGPNRTFRPGPVYKKDQVGYHPGKINIVDWNNDGLPDILLACEGIYTIQYWQNMGNGFIKAASFSVPINALSIKTADLDNDGCLDIVLGPHSGNKIVILWGKKTRFSFDVQTINANQMAHNVEIDDWNHDGKRDIFWVEVVNGSAVVALNQGNRKFSKRYLKKPGKPIGLAKDAPEFIKIADLDSDGCKDAAVTLEVGKACLIFYGDCKGHVIKKERIQAPSWGFSGLAAIGRGKRHPPMLALGEEMKIFIAKRLQGSWQLEQKPAGSLPRDFSFIDIDHDGNVDLLISNTAGETIGILYGPY